MKVDKDTMQKERDGLQQMRALNTEFLASNEGSDAVREFLSKAIGDEALLLIFLKGRKFRPKHAWDTLKRKAEVRFDEYPQMFPDDTPKYVNEIHEQGILGVLKNPDHLGRRIVCCNTSKWDPNKFSLSDILTTGVLIMENLLYDAYALKNGTVFIQNCSGMGMSHGKQYTVHVMMRIIHVFWSANPMPVKGIYYVNVPYFLTFLYEIIKPFLPRKMKERFCLSTSRQPFQALHQHVPPEFLPEFLGGDLKEDSLFINYFRKPFLQ